MICGRPRFRYGLVNKVLDLELLTLYKRDLPRGVGCC